MLSHVNIGANDVAGMAAFYDAVLLPLGITRFYSDPDVCGWRGPADGPALYVGRPFDGGPAGVGNGSMCAFRAPGRDAVDAVHRLALAHGGTSEGAPGLRRYKPGYYGAYFRDPEGNKLHVVAMLPPGEAAQLIE